MPRTRPVPCALLLCAACGLERLEAALEEHRPTATGDVAASDTAADSTSGADTTGDAASTTGADTSTGASGADTRGDPGTTGTTTTGTTTTTTATTTGSTTDALAVCGDGQLDPGEECDDGDADPGNGCKECTRDRFIFATSVEYQGGELQGLFGADQRCRMLAAIAGLPNFGSYRAWLSDSTASAADRLLHTRGRYLLVNGLVVALDWDDLTDGHLLHPINVTEKSETSVGSRVWTGTLASGQPAFGSSFCLDWSDAKGWDNEEGGTGIRTQTDALWSYLDPGPCAAIAVLYCLEQ